MTVSVLGLTFIEWAALYGAVMSTGAIFLSFWVMRRDRGNIRLTGMVGKARKDATGRTIITCLDDRGESCLAFNITNVGRRAIVVKALAAKEKMLRKKEIILDHPALPKTLNEGESVPVLLNNFRFIKDKPWSIYVWDSKGKNYKMKRKDLKRFYKQYDEYVATQKAEASS